jgi:hypothetical protein
MKFTKTNFKPWSSVIHGKNSGSFVPSVAAANSVFTALASPWSSRVGSFVGTDTKFNSVVIRDMTDATFPEFESTDAAFAGISGGTDLPMDVAVVVTEVTTTRGRGARGRIYLAGWTAAAMSATGTITPPLQTALNSMGTDWFGTLASLSLTPCVAKVHRQAYTGLSGAQHPDRPATSADVTAYVCRDLEFDTQRRRGL